MPDERLPRPRDPEREHDEPADPVLRAAPIAWPTRMAPALAIPNAGMNETELIWMTAIMPASGVVPRPATTTFDEEVEREELEEPVEPGRDPVAEHAPELRRGAADAAPDRGPSRNTAEETEEGDRRRDRAGDAAPDAERGRPEMAVDRGRQLPKTFSDHRRDARAHRQAGVAEAAVVVRERLHADRGAAREQPDARGSPHQRAHVGRVREERQKAGDERIAPGGDRGHDRHGEAVEAVAAGAGEVALAEELRGERTRR